MEGGGRIPGASVGVSGPRGSSPGARRRVPPAAREHHRGPQRPHRPLPERGHEEGVLLGRHPGRPHADLVGLRHGHRPRSRRPLGVPLAARAGLLEVSYTYERLTTLPEEDEDQRTRYCGDIVGTGWTVPIEHTRASFSFPDVAGDPAASQDAAFICRVGSAKDRLNREWGDQGEGEPHITRTHGPLEPREALSVRILLPPSVYSAAPTGAEEGAAQPDPYHGWKSVLQTCAALSPGTPSTGTRAGRRFRELPSVTRWRTDRDTSRRWCPCGPHRCSSSAARVFWSTEHCSSGWRRVSREGRAHSA